MSVIDNQLNWRRGFPCASIDVSGRTMAEKMELPDNCFGSRKVVDVSRTASGADVTTWNISGIALPAEICVWEISLFPRKVTSTLDFVRFGLRGVCPASQAQMDEAIPILPNFGSTTTTPPRVFLSDGGMEVWSFRVRKGLATGGLKLVIEVYSATVKCAMIVCMTYSELPTKVPAFLDPGAA